MNRIFKSSFLALGLVACSVGSAYAYPAVWTDTYDPSDVLLERGSGPINFTHDLGNDGFNAGVDTVYAASLTVWLYDDNLFGDNRYLGDGSETVKFNFDSTGWSAGSEVNGWGLNLGWLDDILEHTFTFNSLTALLSDGLLDVSLKSGAGDFRFDKSLLVAYGNRASVPEPATVALLGAGLLGFAMAQRRRRRQSAI